MSGSESKNKPASQKKLNRKRREGSIPIVADVAALLTSALLLIVTSALASYFYERLIATFQVIERAMTMPFIEAVNIALSDIATLLALAVIPLVGAAILISVLTTIIYNGGILFSLNPISPKFDRMSPVTGFGRMFGRRSFIETGVAATRLLLWFGASGILVWRYYADAFEGAYCGSSCLVEIGFSLLIWLMLGAFLLFVVSSILEMILQKNIFLHEQRMTDSEVKKEAKEMSGSPEVKKEQRRLRQELADVADSIGPDKANMLFYWEDRCVALRYHPELAPVPKLSAKATSRVAMLALRERVERNGFRTLEHEDVVLTCIKTPLGSAINTLGQHALIDGMSKMFK